LLWKAVTWLFPSIKIPSISLPTNTHRPVISIHHGGHIKLIRLSPKQNPFINRSRGPVWNLNTGVPESLRAPTHPCCMDEIWRRHETYSQRHALSCSETHFRRLVQSWNTSCTSSKAASLQKLQTKSLTLCMPELSFLHSTIQSSILPEVTRTQVRRIWRVVKGYRVIALHLANEFLSVVSVCVRYVHG
jgi:hypothetical protein